MKDLVSGIFDKRIKDCENSIARMDKDPDRYSDDSYQPQFSQKLVLEKLKEEIMGQNVDSLCFGPADTKSICRVPVGRHVYSIRLFGEKIQQTKG